MSKIPEVKGDSVSKLLQVRAAMKGVYMRWTGDGIQDIDLLCLEYFHRKTLNECLWNGLKQLMDMPELKTLPESIQAQICSIVLRSQANFELARAEKLGSQPPPMPPLPRQGDVV
jgi:hypothetical protein